MSILTEMVKILKVKSNFENEKGKREKRNLALFHRKNLMYSKLLSYSVLDEGSDFTSFSISSSLLKIRMFTKRFCLK